MFLLYCGMKKVVFFLIVIISFFIIQDFLRSIYNLWQKRELLDFAKKELEAKQIENKKLKYQLKIAQSDEFVEKEARDKLLMLKEGEKEIVLDDSLIGDKNKKGEGKEDNRSNIQKWWNLFF